MDFYKTFQKLNNLVLMKRQIQQEWDTCYKNRGPFIDSIILKNHNLITATYKDIADNLEKYKSGPISYDIGIDTMTIDNQERVLQQFFGLEKRLYAITDLRKDVYEVYRNEVVYEHMDRLAQLIKNKINSFE
jgi:hypothetical protein